MDFMTLLAAALPDNLIGKWLVQLSDKLPTFGGAGIVFTIIVRLLFFPLEI